MKRTPCSSVALSLGRLLGLTTKQHVDLLLDPVLVVGLIRLRVCAIPERTIMFSFNAKAL